MTVLMLDRPAGSVGLVSTLDNYGRVSARLDDSLLYGRSTPADRQAWLNWQFDAISENGSARREWRAADEYGRAAYHYACGWADALKMVHGLDYAWQARGRADVDLLTHAWFFGDECKRADYAFRMGECGSRYGFGHAWELYLGAQGIVL